MREVPCLDGILFRAAPVELSRHDRISSRSRARALWTVHRIRRATKPVQLQTQNVAFRAGCRVVEKRDGMKGGGERTTTETQMRPNLVLTITFKYHVSMILIIQNDELS